MNADIVDIDVTELVDGTLVDKGQQPLTPEGEDREPIHADTFEALGLWARCSPATNKGKCEAVTMSGVGGLNEVTVGRRDTRFGPKLGKALPGDTGIASTDPDTDVQVRCHGTRKQLIMFARKGDPTSEQAFINLDAKREKFQFIGFGGTLEFSKQNGWIMRDGTGQGFHMHKGHIQFSVTSGKLSSNPAGLPLRQGATPLGGAPVPGWFAMVAHLWAWIKWQVWRRLPKLPARESETV